MQEITILPEPPMIFTKDKNWFESQKHFAKPGDVFLLPDDAVLVMAPQIMEVKSDLDIVVGPAEPGKIYRTREE